MADSTVRVNFVGDNKDLKRAIDSSEKELSGFSGAVQKHGKNIALGMAGAAVGVAVLAKSAVDAASDQNEALSKSNTVFGDAAKEVADWSKTTAKSMGLSRTEALSAAGGFGNLFDQLGIGSKESAKLSKEMVGLAADFASFHNADITQVLEAQSAAFRGEYDALQRFVPTISAATVEQKALEMTGKSLTKELTAQEKALAVNALMFEGAGQAAGDFARTSDGAANQQRILKARISDLQAEIGQKLLPIYQDLLAFTLDELIPALEKTAAWLDENVVPALKDLSGWIKAEVIPVVQDMARIFREDVVPALMLTAAIIKDEIIPRVQAITRFWIELGTKAYEIVVGTATLISNLATTIKGFASDIKNALGDIFQPIVDAVRPAVEEALKWLDKLLGPIDEILGKVAKLPKLGSSKDLFERVEEEQRRRGGGKAMGGAVSAGMTYTVGENGPELLTMGGAGFITPNHKLGGGSTTININMPPGADGDDVVRAIKDWERRNGPLASN